MANGGVKTQSERLRHGAQAEIELPLMRAAIRKLRAQIFETFEATDPNDSAGRERLYVALKLLPEIEQDLVHAINDGALAETEIEAANFMSRVSVTRVVQ